MGEFNILNNPADFALGGPFYPNADNFPGLALAIRDLEQTSGSQVIIPVYSADGIASIAITGGTNDEDRTLLLDADGMYTLNDTATAALTPNTPIVTPFSGTVLLITVGKANTGQTSIGVTLGGITGTGSIGLNSNGVAFRDATPDDSYTPAGTHTVTTALAFAKAGVYRMGGTDVRSIHANLTQLSNVATANVTGAIANLNGTVPTNDAAANQLSMQPVTGATIGANGGRIKAFYWFNLATDVSDAFITSVLAWMAGNPGKLCPLLRGKV